LFKNVGTFLKKKIWWEASPPTKKVSRVWEFFSYDFSTFSPIRSDPIRDRLKKQQQHQKPGRLQCSKEIYIFFQKWWSLHERSENGWIDRKISDFHFSNYGHFYDVITPNFNDFFTKIRKLIHHSFHQIAHYP